MRLLLTRGLTALALVVGGMLVGYQLSPRMRADDASFSYSGSSESPPEGQSAFKPRNTRTSPPTAPNSDSDPKLAARLHECEKALAVAETLLSAHDEAERGTPRPMPERLQSMYTPDSVDQILAKLAERCGTGPMPVVSVSCDEYPCLAAIELADTKKLEGLLECEHQGAEFIGFLGAATWSDGPAQTNRFVLSIHNRDYVASQGPDPDLSIRENWRAEETISAWVVEAEP